MSAPVDVLAVLDSQIRGVEQDGKTIAVGLREARDAVAELVEAAEYMLAASMQMTPQADQLRDALARVGGEA